MRALVMGGSEFVSRAIAKHLISEGYCVDIFTRGIKPVNYEGVNNHFKGDRKKVEDLQVLAQEKYDCVFDISAYTKEDVEKLSKILNRESLKSYVFCSSASVYKPTDEMVSEEFNRGENPNWGPYGTNKMEAEDYLMKLNKEEGFPMTIFRPTYIYGEGNNLYREIFFFNRITQGLDIPIPPKDSKSQFIHINDLVKAFESCVHTEASRGEAYNITYPDVISWEDLAETAMKVVDKKVNVKKVNSDLNINAREYFPFRDVTCIFNVNKAEKDGIHVPEIDLYEGLKRAYEWYCSEKPKTKDLRMNKVDYVLNI